MGTESTEEGQDLVAKFKNGTFVLSTTGGTEGLSIRSRYNHICIKDITQVTVGRTNCSKEWQEQMLDDHVGSRCNHLCQQNRLKLRREKNSRRRGW